MAAIDFPGSPTNGQTFTDGDKTWVYSTTVGAWRLQTQTLTGATGPTGPTGPTGVGATGATGPTGPEGGSTTLTTKGDLLTRNASALARLPVGATNGHVLTVDNSTDTGVKWAASSGGGGTVNFQDEQNVFVNQVFG